MKTIYLLMILAGLCKSIYMPAVNASKQFTLTNPCTPSVTIIPVPGTYGCYSFTADNGITGDPDSYYLWDFGDNTSDTGKTIYHCYSPVTNGTNYTVSLTYQSPALCGVTPNVQNFIIILNPPAGGSCVSPTPSITVNGYSVTVWAGSGIPEIMTRYFFGDGYWSATNSHVYSNCGNYIITVKQWDMNQPSDTCYAYNAVNLSCDGSTGIEEAVNDREILFPNPCSNSLGFSVNTPLGNISIKDIIGREVYRKVYGSTTNDLLELAELAPGAYLFIIRYKNGKQKSLKFIKE